MVIDGSIQGFSARLRWPGYYDGAPNGLWYTTPEQLREALELALADGTLVHIHTNGDEATELVLDSLEHVLRRRPALFLQYYTQSVDKNIKGGIILSYLTRHLDQNSPKDCHLQFLFTLF